ETLIAANITDSRTLKKRDEVQLGGEDYYVIQSLDPDQPNLLPERFWSAIRNRLVSQYKFNPSTVQFILDYFDETRWRVYNDVDSQRIFKKLIEERIPDKYTRVRAGSRIIDHGEIVSPRHIAMMNAMK